MAMSLDERFDQVASMIDDKEVTLIVQMKTGIDSRRLLNDAIEQIESRRSVITARDLLGEIPEYEKLLENIKKRSESVSSGKGSGTISASSKFSYTATDLDSDAKSSFKPLFDNSFVKELAGASWDQIRSLTKNPSNSVPRRSLIPLHFMSSSTAILRFTKDKLTKVRDELSSLPVADVFVSRIVRVPSVSKTSGLPPEVADNSAYTWGLSKTGAMACWGAFEARGQGVKIAVLDTGYDPTHPDLANKLAKFAEFDENGGVVPSKPHDDHGHGTHCSATIVGGDESTRCIGMAPHAKILSAMVLPNGSGTDTQILAGIDWAVQNNADIINMSLGGLRMTPDVMDTYTMAIIKANLRGIPVVVAVGNEGSQTSSAPGNDLFAFTVGATDVDDRAAGFSGGRTQIIEESRYIPESKLPFVYSKPDVTAPGVNVYSAVPTNGKPPRWEAWNGSSMATPHVAGAMALLLSASPGLLGLRVKDRTQIIQDLIVSTVKELGESGQNHRYGYGRIDILRALGHAKSCGYIPKPVAPSGNKLGSKIKRPAKKSSRAKP